ncbi:SDR family NAD(P)-dependent oxidoreductase [Curtobacterium flaccumfaciens]|uniref:SDR family NAD(P)-dependent oxidoreductase n=1 Tax=Curtobacterium flaccumfaciens TaxID=2035 RepID=UPI00343E1257
MLQIVSAAASRSSVRVDRCIRQRYKVTGRETASTVIDGGIICHHRDWSLMSALLDGKVAVITGGVGGIGAATAQEFIAAGADVVIADIADDAGQELAERLGDHAAYVHADVTDEASVEALVAAAVDRFGRLDVMYNNAGATGDPAAVVDLSASAFDSLMALDVRSVLLGHKYAARQFRAQASGGSIITTASVAGIQGGWSSVGYTTAKHAVLGIMRQAALELGPHGIRSNAVAPGVVMTAIQAKAFGVPLDHAASFNDHIVDRLGSQQPMGRFGLPSDIARAAVFLASDLSEYVNGVVLPVDGGASAFTQSSFADDMTAVTEQFLDSIR